MKQFLYRTFLFTLIPVLYFGINSQINFGVYSNQEIPVDDTEVLIAGDSHPMTAINPYLFESAQNISMSAEPYAITYWKLRQIFQISLPEVLILGFAPHNFSDFNDVKFSAPRFSHEMFTRIYSMDKTVDKLEDIEPFAPVDFVEYYKTFWKQTSFYPHNDHINYIGQFLIKNSSNLSDWQEIIQRHYYMEDSICNISELSEFYLDSIAGLCFQKNVDLILAGNPVHHNYYSAIPDRFIDAFNRIKAEFDDRVLIVDKTSTVYPDSLFSNSDHLNVLGSRRFTGDIIDSIKKEKVLPGGTK